MPRKLSYRYAPVSVDFLDGVLTLLLTLVLALVLALALTLALVLVHEIKACPIHALLLVADAWVVWWVKANPYSMAVIYFSTIAIPVVTGS